MPIRGNARGATRDALKRKLKGSKPKDLISTAIPQRLASESAEPSMSQIKLSPMRWVKSIGVKRLNPYPGARPCPA